MAAAQKGPETFRATATAETAGGAKVTAPVTIVIARTTPAEEGQALAKAFTTGGESALRKALAGLAETGSVRIGDAAPTVARIALDRPTEKGRLLTIVTDKPILFVGGGLPDAPPQEGYGFGVLDIEVDANGNGSGTLSPAARVKVVQGAFVVDDYAATGDPPDRRHAGAIDEGFSFRAATASGLPWSLCNAGGPAAARPASRSRGDRSNVFSDSDEAPVGAAAIGVEQVVLWDAAWCA